jgi:Mrp family chromosome partitioning ATPase
LAKVPEAPAGSVLEHARAAYDIVLCDAPPVLAVPDPLRVAKHSGGVLLVAEHEHIGDRAEADGIARRIELSGKPICGIIVTKTSGESAGYAAHTGYPNLRVA